AQTASGTYTMVVGPDIRDTLGNQMNQNGNQGNGEATADQYTISGTLTVPPPPPPPPPPPFVSGPRVISADFAGTPSVNVSSVRLTFDKAVDTTTFTAADIASFTGPNGSVSTSYTVTPVSGSGNTQFDVSFSAQTASGTYTMVVGPDIRDTLGNQMNQDG